ncbi:MAG: nucleotidyltransferase domain-containing protein [Candidatus Woesearchaeota archaeon]
MKRKDIKERIQEYFFIHPTAKLRVREIERILGLPLPSVIRYCRELEKEDILMINKIGEVNLYTASRSENYLLEKKLYNLKRLYISGIIEYLKIELSNPVVVVFGSYSKGEDIEESDIDLYLETQSKKKVDLKRFEKILNRKIQVLSHKNIKEIKNLYLANNILNGITLNGVLEVFR